MKCLTKRGTMHPRGTRCQGQSEIQVVISVDNRHVLIANLVPSLFSAPEEFHKVLDRTHSQDPTQLESKSDDEGAKEEETKTEVKKRGNTVRFANI